MINKFDLVLISSIDETDQKIGIVTEKYLVKDEYGVDYDSLEPRSLDQITCPVFKVLVKNFVFVEFLESELQKLN